MVTHRYHVGYDRGTDSAEGCAVDTGTSVTDIETDIPVLASKPTSQDTGTVHTPILIQHVRCDLSGSGLPRRP